MAYPEDEWNQNALELAHENQQRNRINYVKQSSYNINARVCCKTKRLKLILFVVISK